MFPCIRKANLTLFWFFSIAFTFFITLAFLPSFTMYLINTGLTWIWSRRILLVFVPLCELSVRPRHENNSPILVSGGTALSDGNCYIWSVWRSHQMFPWGAFGADFSVWQRVGPGEVASAGSLSPKGLHHCPAVLLTSRHSVLHLTLVSWCHKHVLWHLWHIAQDVWPFSIGLYLFKGFIPHLSHAEATTHSVLCSFLLLCPHNNPVR